MAQKNTIFHVTHSTIFFTLTTETSERKNKKIKITKKSSQFYNMTKNQYTNEKKKLHLKTGGEILNFHT